MWDKKIFLLYRFLGYILSFFSYKAADKIIMTNNSDIDFARKKFFVRPQKIHKIANYVDTDLFTWHRQGQVERILFIGRLSKEKNIVNLCRAIKRLEIGLDIVGAGEQRDELTELVQDELIDVKFLGLFPNNMLPEVINNYSIFVIRVPDLSGYNEQRERVCLI